MHACHELRNKSDAIPCKPSRAESIPMIVSGSYGIRQYAILCVGLVYILLGVLTRSASTQVLLYGDRSMPAETASSSSAFGTYYVRPSQRFDLKKYTFDAFGPYPLVAAALAASLGQLSSEPPEWHLDAESYRKRFGSSLAMAVVGTSTRYAFASAFKEDTMYYRCTCNGFFPRVGYAMLSSVTARHGKDGHRQFSLSSIIAPYAGSAVAVYGWYPDRYGIKDVYQIGSLNLLANAGGNIIREFLSRGAVSMQASVQREQTSKVTDLGLVE